MSDRKLLSPLVSVTKPVNECD